MWGGPARFTRGGLRHPETARPAGEGLRIAASDGPKTMRYDLCAIRAESGVSLLSLSKQREGCFGPLLAWLLGGRFNH